MLPSHPEDLKEPARILTCVYCGMEYPQGTPAWGEKVLTDHIKTCEKHPMKKMSEDYAKVRKALVGLVGEDTKEGLDGMELQLRLLPIPDVDRMNTINAITALRDTLHDAMALSYSLL